MSSVYFPAHVVLVFRRIVNVISTLSISNQYLLLKKAKSDEDPARYLHLAEKSTNVSNSPLLRELKGTQQSWWASGSNWGWPRFVLLESIANAKADAPLRPRWSWPALLSTSTETVTDAHGDTLPPSPTLQNHSKPDTPAKLPPTEPEHDPPFVDTIHRLMTNPALFEPLRTPRYPIVLCHGLYGFDSRGPLNFPSMRMHYWSNVLNILRDTVRAEVIVTSVPGTGSIPSRAEILDQQLQHKARGRGINFLAHSMGGLDCRHLITHLKPEEYAPLSLTTISTPHRGSPFMDWCAENIGIGKLRQQEQNLARSRARNTTLNIQADTLPPPKPDTPFSLSLASLPSSFTTLLLSIVDSPAYANLTSAYLNDVFNPATPDDPSVKYFSVAGRMAGVSIWHPFWLPKIVLDGVEEKHRASLRAAWEQDTTTTDSGRPLWAQERMWGNDGLVTVQSAKWGEFLGIMEGCDHWEMRGARGIEFGVDLPALPAIGLGVSTAGHRSAAGDGWGLPDWGRFVGAWKKEEKLQRDKAAVVAGAGAGPSSPAEEQREQQREAAAEDAMVKSTTDRLSAVFDWLADQVPAPKSKAVADAKARTLEDIIEKKAQAPVSDMQKRMDQEGQSRRKNELETKKDLERFYVALSKKLYDEGL